MRKFLFTALLIWWLPVVCVAQDPFVFRPATDIPVFQNNQELPLAWAGGLNSGQYFNIDLNNDGTEDLVIFDRTTDKVNTFLNVDNRFLYHPQYEYLFPDDLNSWIVLADYDCDGRKDLFANTTFGLKVYRNTFDQQLSFQLQADPLMSESGSIMVNLQISSSDMPSISDIDGDGDLDILIFNFAVGGSVEYHQNQSIETDGTCNNLLYKKITSNYGDFQECNCGVYAFGETCGELGGRQTHAGGKSLLTLDRDHDGDQELIFGDEFCNNIAFLENQGDAQDALFTEAILDYPNAANPIDFFIFPAVYLVDVNFDGAKDLIAAPNMFENLGRLVDFRRSSRLYTNQALATSEEFDFQQDNWLQDEMLDFGEKAAPLFFDFDGDGDHDMLVGSRGERLGEEFFASFALYENQGDSDQANYHLINDDYLNLGAQRLQDLKPSYADLNGDNRLDLIFSAAASNGQTSVYYFLNEDLVGFTPQTSLPQILPLIIQAGDYPHFVDLDGNGWADLLLGRRAGRLEYWRNLEGTGSNFELVNEAVAGIIDDSFKRELVPLAADLNGDQVLELATLDATGVMRVYTNFLSTSEIDPPQQFDLVLQPQEQQGTELSRWGRGAAITSAALTSGLPHLIVGSNQGGLFLLQNFSDTSGGSDPQRELALQLFPNPADDLVEIRANQNFSWKLYNILGQEVLSGPSASLGNRYQFEGLTLVNGVYLLRATGASGIKETKRLLIVH